tara:strand:- start:2113 stop:2475 length:363 start_codon:yes stop_codon:yes gene_type:complete
MNNSNKNNELNYLKLIKDNIDNKVFIITKNDCPLCEKLKQLFDTIEIKYTTHLYEETYNEKNNNFPFKTEMKTNTGGKLFPFCYFNGTYVGGYKEIHHNLITGKLKEQLNDIGLDYEEDF